MKKGNNPRYIFSPYIMLENTPIISDSEESYLFYNRLYKLRKRKEKIEKIINKINE